VAVEGCGLQFLFDLRGAGVADGGGAGTAQRVNGFEAAAAGGREGARVNFIADNGSTDQESAVTTGVNVRFRHERPFEPDVMRSNGPTGWWPCCTGPEHGVRAISKTPRGFLCGRDMRACWQATSRRVP